MKKGKLLENGEIKNKDLEIDIFFLEPFADKLKKISIKDDNQYFDKIFIKNDEMYSSKFNNIEQMELDFQKLTSINNLFVSFQYLSYLKLKCASLVNLNDHLFLNLKKLEQLELYLNPEIKLSKNHFDGLENLQKLTLDSFKIREKSILLDMDLDYLVNLTELRLRNVEFNQFSLNGLEKLENLELTNFNFSKKILNKQSNTFKNLKNLKCLEIYGFTQPFTTSDKDEKAKIAEILVNIPSNVQILKTSDKFFAYLNSMEIPFIYKLKALEINIEFYEEMIAILSFIRDNLFTNLEKLVLSIEFEKLTNFTTFPHLTCKQFEDVKNLKILHLQNVIVSNDVDEELKNLTEASFNLQIPKNISNFSNLEKLYLKNIEFQISINERFLEDLIHLKELYLQDVFSSIDDAVQFLFKRSTKLKRLTLIHNKMTTVKSSYFELLIELEELILEWNDIKAIQPGAFKNLTKLKYLNLYFNPIEGFSLPEDTFETNMNLEKIVFNEPSFKYNGEINFI